MIPVIVSSVLSFLIVYLLAPIAKDFLEKTGMIATDQQKPMRPKMATSGGMLVISGIIFSGFFFIGVNSFILDTAMDLTGLLAAYCSIGIITMIGFVDDINMEAPRRRKGLHDHRIGLKQWQKPLLTLPAAVPLMAVMAGTSKMSLPLIGMVDFGLLYPLILIPLIVVVVSNGMNMLAGMNGLESGLGAVSLLSLGAYSLVTGNPEAGLLGLSSGAALLAFLKWNWFPARFLPGDSLTYMIGAVFASVTILGNIEKFAFVLFIPWVAEVLLKMRSRFSARSLGNLRQDRTLKPPYNGTYSLTHVVMRMGLKENEITKVLILMEIVFVAVAFAISV